MQNGVDANSMLSMLRSVLDEKLTPIQSTLEILTRRDLEHQHEIELLNARCNTSDERLAALEQRLQEMADAQEARERESESRVALLEKEVAALRQQCKTIKTAPGHATGNVQAAGARVHNGAGGAFVPGRLFLRGWCQFGFEAEHGISGSEAATVADSVLSLLEKRHEDMIERHMAPYFRNRQITLQLVEGLSREQVSGLFESLRTALQTTPQAVHGKNIFVVMDSPPWKKERNAAVARASRAWREVTKWSEAAVTLDWPSGSVYVAPSEGRSRCIGQFEKGAWKWHEHSIALLSPAVTVAALEAAWDQV
jgi:hypothetical protein